ncbi:hypothetical protein MP638_006093 [Amoeboaphelidium occidentale]|nr:hypothetical protein MP638_006093 [Amoeboaphelidium occidentale]
MQCDEVFCARTLEEKIGKYVKSWTSQPVPDKRNSEWRSSSVTNTIRLPQFLSFAKGRGFLITCGTDRNLRYWDCNSIEKSFLINGPESLEDKHYSSYRVNNTIFHYERMYSQQEPRKSTTRKAIYQQDHAHTDSITDVIVAEYPIPFIISASRDGVINIIK